MTKKRKRSAIVRDLDREFSIFIRRRDGNRCVVCGSDHMPQCGHLFSRVAYSTRWDELNCHCQCAKCNINHERDHWPFTKWFLEKFGKKALGDLHAKYNKPRKFLDHELQELLNEYRRKNKEGAEEVHVQEPVGREAVSFATLQRRLNMEEVGERLGGRPERAEESDA